MKRFLGIRVGSVPQTDDEVIHNARELVRRYRRFGKWTFFLHAVPLFLHLTFAVVAVIVLMKVGLMAAGNLAWVGLVLGFTVGMSLGFYAGWSFQNLISAEQFLYPERRKAELLVKYYDSLVELAQLPSTEAPAPGTRT